MLAAIVRGLGPSLDHLGPFSRRLSGLASCAYASRSRKDLACAALRMQCGPSAGMQLAKTLRALRFRSRSGERRNQTARVVCHSRHLERATYQKCPLLFGRRTMALGCCSWTRTLQCESHRPLASHLLVKSALLYPCEPALSRLPRFRSYALRPLYYSSSTANLRSPPLWPAYSVSPLNEAQRAPTKRVGEFSLHDMN